MLTHTSTGDLYPHSGITFFPVHGERVISPNVKALINVKDFRFPSGTSRATVFEFPYPIIIFYGRPRTLWPPLIFRSDIRSGSPFFFAFDTPRDMKCGLPD